MIIFPANFSENAQPQVFTFKAHLWRYQGPAAWHFITLPKKLSEAVKVRSGENRKAWGSVKVSVKIGLTQWATSLFPDKRLNAYLLPIKESIRKTEKISNGDRVTVTIGLSSFI